LARHHQILDKVLKLRPLKLFIFGYWHDEGWKGFVGATVKLWDLATNMARFGHDVFLFVPRYEFAEDNPHIQLVRIPLLDLPFLRSLSFSFFLIMFLIWYHFKCRPDVVYIRRGISIVPAIFAILRQALLMYEVNDDPYAYATRHAQSKGILTHFERRLAIRTEELILSWCDAAFVITRDIRHKIIQHLPLINTAKIHVVPSGANTELYRPIDQGFCRSKLNMDSSRKYIGFIGTLLEHQGVNILIDAAPFVLQTFPNACFVVIGEGPMKEAWIRRVHELVLQEHFVFTGQIDYEQSPLWINAMDVCTAPFSIRAGLRSPVKIFDYLACGKPVVASRIPGTTDIFAESGAVLLVEPEHKNELATAIVDILTNVEKAHDMGLKGRRFVETQYDRKLLAKKVEEVTYALEEAKEKLSPLESV